MLRTEPHDPASRPNLASPRPRHVIVFLRKNKQSHNEATFRVPLTFTKFDIRDYLWNLYGVEVTKVRSQVIGRPLTLRNNYTNRYYRPRFAKVMTVGLVEPFQWPEIPRKTDDFYKSLYDLEQKKIREMREEQNLRATMQLKMMSEGGRSPERRSLAKQAKDLLSGQKRWDNGVVLDEKWEKILEQQEKSRETAASRQ